ncbi:MAG: hypothetical protein PHY03_01835 [Dehalococcoidia bacterium]|nr:hypothetical protein [Dehalococcoidia bacterium]
MCCFVTLFLLIGPRFALVCMWLFSDMVTRVFGTNFIIPLLGIIFLPYTAIFYFIVYLYMGMANPFAWALVILGFIIDISAYGGGWWGNRGRLRR